MRRTAYRRTAARSTLLARSTSPGYTTPGMLTSIGRRPHREDLLGLLLDCHQRIRTFLRLAQEIGRREGLPESEVVDACRRCESYFVEALPLHLEDEEQSLLPRLVNIRPDLDSALEAMHSQHAAHEALIDDMLTALREVRRAPADAASRDRLRSTATLLAAELEDHLSVEEQVIFPAVESLLAAEVQAEVIAELRARRQPRG
jgi:iron-sulfur cluster repair protein YtfE (RIC family)